jgi:hypothetical protein
MFDKPPRKLRSLDSMYNCMGMVFGCRRTWIEPEHFQKICADDGYRQLPGIDQALPGDVVAYHRSNGTVEHVAVVLQPPVAHVDPDAAPWGVLVLSQWGRNGEYIHDFLDLPPALAALNLVPAAWTDRGRAP